MNMVKVQDAPSVAHKEMSRVYRVLQQGAYLQLYRISTAQGARIDLLVHQDASIDLCTRHDRGLMQAQPVCWACVIVAAGLGGIRESLA